jgi:putative transcriptional regulator
LAAENADKRRRALIPGHWTPIQDDLERFTQTWNLRRNSVEKCSGAATLSASFRFAGAMQVSREHTLAIPADGSDPEDRPVSQAALERAQMGRRIRRLRTALGLSQTAFAERYGIPVANIRQYEIGRTMPPPAVQSFLKVIAAEPERAAAALVG